MDLRRQHRIIYQTKIRMRASGRDDSVVARVQNLSARGMFVTASDLPEAGTEVQCRLTLGGERRTIRGRVAWVRPASPAAPLKSPGAGIEFIELEERDSELLTRLVEPGDEKRQPVDVWFEGMQAPVRCHAVVVGDGLRLETRLPFMRLRSQVRVAFSSASQVDTREGIVDGITLEPSPEDGVPFLRVAVSMPPLEYAQGMIETHSPPAAVGAAAPVIAPMVSTVVDPAVAHPGPFRSFGAPATQPLGPEHENTHRMGFGERSPLPAPATSVPAAAPVPAAPMNAGASAATPVFRFVPALVGLVIGAGLVGTAAFVAWPKLPVSVPGELAPAAEGTAAAVATEAPSPTPAAGEAPAVAPPVAEEPAAAAGPHIEPINEPHPPPADEAPVAGDRGITIDSANDRMLVTLAVTGSTAGAQEIRYSEPPGIGVILPRARPRGGFGNLASSGDPVRVVARRRGGGSLVRLLFDPKKYQGKLAIEGEALRLSLHKR